MPATIPDIWNKTVNLVKDRVNQRSLWEAMEKAVGITIEDDVFIIGLNPSIFNMAGYMTSALHRNAIDRSLSEAAGRELHSRVIEGDTVADWEALKKREARVATVRAANYEHRDRIEAESQSWDSVYDYVARTFTSTPMRQLPQVKSRYLTDMLYALCDAVDALYPTDPDEHSERMFARVLDRVAQNADVPATLVAMELERLRAWRAQSPS